MLHLHLNRLEEWDSLARLEGALRSAARAALDTAAHPPIGELSITFVTEDEIRELSRRYLERDAPTDVIAFQLGEDDRLLGDGTLHLLGHDHPDGPERWGSPMFVLQERLVAELAGKGARDDSSS